MGTNVSMRPWWTCARSEAGLHKLAPKAGKSFQGEDQRLR